MQLQFNWTAQRSKTMWNSLRMYCYRWVCCWCETAAFAVDPPIDLHCKNASIETMGTGPVELFHGNCPLANGEIVCNHKNQTYFIEFNLNPTKKTTKN